MQALPALRQPTLGRRGWETELRYLYFELTLAAKTLKERDQTAASEGKFKSFHVKPTWCSGADAGDCRKWRKLTHLQLWVVGYEVPSQNSALGWSASSLDCEPPSLSHPTPASLGVCLMVPWMLRAGGRVSCSVRWASPFPSPEPSADTWRMLGGPS